MIDTAFDLLRGPFFLLHNDTGARVPQARAVVRCADARGRHFLAAQDCAGGAGTPEEVVGYAAGERTGGWASALARCWCAAEGGFFYHTVHAGPTAACAVGDEAGAELGFVI